MRVAIAIVVGLVILAFGFSTIRGLLVGRGGAGGATELPPRRPSSRITFRCENCGTEVLVLVQGSDAPPRHCGESMQRREEVVREN